MSRARIVTTNVDRLVALRVAHAATRPEQPFEEYAAVRFRTPLRRGGDWWLLEDDDGVPVTSLMCYPLDLSHGRERLEAYGLGAVATHPDHRGRGHASRLCAEVGLRAESKGRSTGLLFSAIPPALYERLGFEVAPAYAWQSTDLESLSGVAAEPLTPVDGTREAERLAPLYEAAHPGLHSFRDAEGFHRSCMHSYEDVFFTVGDPVRGYVRLHLEDPEELELTELIVPEADEPAVLAAVFDLARRLGRPSVVGWMPPTPTIESVFETDDRSKTLPMVRGHHDLAGAMFWSSDYF